MATDGSPSSEPEITVPEVKPSREPVASAGEEPTASPAAKPESLPQSDKLSAWHHFDSFFFHRWIGVVFVLLGLVWAFEMNMRGIHLILIASCLIFTACLFHAQFFNQQPFLIRILGTLFSGSAFSLLLYFAFWNYHPPLVEDGPCVSVDSVTFLGLESANNLQEVVITFSNHSNNPQEIYLWTAFIIIGSPPLTETVPPVPLKTIHHFLLRGSAQQQMEIPFGSIGDTRDLVLNGTAFAYFYGDIYYHGSLHSYEARKYKYSICAVYDPVRHISMQTPFGNDINEISSMPAWLAPDK
jgi:hypothetical protein